MRSIATCVLLVAVAACSPAPADLEKQSQKYWEQAEAADEQLKIMAAQQQKVEEQQKIAEEQLRRTDELLLSSRR